jgi:hypothetical protein
MALFHFCVRRPGFFSAQPAQLYVRTEDIAVWLKELADDHEKRGNKEAAKWLRVHNGDFGLTVMKHIGGGGR